MPLLRSATREWLPAIVIRGSARESGQKRTPAPRYTYDTRSRAAMRVVFSDDGEDGATAIANRLSCKHLWHPGAVADG